MVVSLNRTHILPVLFLLTGSFNSYTQNGPIKTLQRCYLDAVDADPVIYGHTAWCRLWRYDKNGHKVEAFFWKGDSSYTTHQVFINDSSGNVIEEQEQRNGEPLRLISRSEYTSSGKLRLEIEYDEDSTESWRSIYTYDEHDNKIEYRGSSQKSRISSSTHYEFNSKGQMISRSHNTISDFEWRSEKSTFVYDSLGNQIEEYDASWKTPYLELSMKYDDKGNVIEENYYKNGSVNSRYTYKYDDVGRTIEKCEYGSDSLLVRKTEYAFYDFDNYGNWLKKVTYINGVMDSADFREIEYYSEE